LSKSPLSKRRATEPSVVLFFTPLFGVVIHIRDSSSWRDWFYYSRI